jgi:hypothetical protein
MQAPAWPEEFEGHGDTVCDRTICSRVPSAGLPNSPSTTIFRVSGQMGLKAILSSSRHDDEIPGTRLAFNIVSCYTWNCPLRSEILADLGDHETSTAFVLLLA